MPGLEVGQGKKDVKREGARATWNLQAQVRVYKDGLKTLFFWWYGCSADARVLCHRANHTHLAQESEKVKENVGRVKVEQLV